MKINGIEIKGEIKAGIEVMSFDDTNKFTFITIGELFKLYKTGFIDLKCIIDDFKVQRDQLPTGKNSTKKFDICDLIFSVMTGVKIGSPNFAYWKGEWKVTDGQQRCSAIFRFLNNEFALKFSDKKIKLDGNYLNNKFFNQLSKELREKIENITISITILELKSLEDFLLQFIKTNNGKAVTNVEKYKSMLGKNAPVFEELLQKRYIKNILSTLPDSRENKLDIVIKLAYMVYWNVCKNTKKTKKEIEAGESYAINNAKIEKFIQNFKADKFLSKEVIQETVNVLDYMAMAFDTKEYNSYDKLPSESDPNYKFLGKKKVHSLALFACAITALDKKINATELFNFTKYMHISVGKRICNSESRGNEDYEYNYWNRSDNTASDGIIHMCLKNAFKEHLIKKGLWIDKCKEKKSVEVY